MDYSKFLETKAPIVSNLGKPIEPDNLPDALFDFQRDIVAWAVRKGRGAIFADVGLGKTIMQLSWALALDVPTLIVAPLAVAHQTVNEAHKLLKMELRYVRTMKDVNKDHKFYITNYEMLDKFDAEYFQAVVLDESSILKAYSGVTKKAIIKKFKDTPYRLACTATPAPNDILEIGNHAEFLGIMKSTIMTSIFFIHDSNLHNGQAGYRLKKHGIDRFYEWLASWSVAIKKPSDLSYPDDGYELPELNVELHEVNTDYTPAGMLQGFNVQAISATAARKLRKKTIQERADLVSDMVNSSNEQFIIWCGLNDEADLLNEILHDSVNVEGKMSTDDKINSLNAFVNGDVKVLISKTSIAGMGINMQNCHNMIFFGIDYSWESFYQAIGRIYRFGQKSDNVNVYVVTSSQETQIYDNIMRKNEQAKEMTRQLIGAMDIYQKDGKSKGLNVMHTYQTDETKDPMGQWELWLGDSCERMTEIESDTVGLSVYSPPFESIYVYTATERDLGNSKDMDTFLSHYRFIIDELFRITKQGRVTCVHLQDKKMYANRDGYRGIYDMTGRVIQEYVDAGWEYRARITIDKNPQLVATRNKDTDLLFVTGKRDSAKLAPMHTDYLLVFRKPGDNPDPVTPYDNGEMTEQDWIEWAHPVWYGIRETDVLNVSVARQNEDERHICPLQLSLIERCIKLWSNPNDLIFSPFAGIGSEGYEAVKAKRRFLGIELKPEYYNVAVRNLKDAEIQANGKTLFDLLPDDEAI